MAQEPTPSFQQVVCHTPAVRTAFAVCPALRHWWRIILFLHGKPRDPQMAPSERMRCIADGFGFYAWLYRLLSIIFLVFAGLLALLQGIGSTEMSAYWWIASGMGSLYLWGVSGLGYHGTRAYRQALSQQTLSHSVTLLVSFMVMIVAFLSLFVATLSVVTQYQSWANSVLNLAALGALFVFGVGSYLIEIVYLVREANHSANA